MVRKMLTVALFAGISLGLSPAASEASGYHYGYHCHPARNTCHSHGHYRYRHHGMTNYTRPATTSTSNWGSAVASYYTLYGNRTADGTIMSYGNAVVAHKTMGFGTRCTFSYNGRSVTGTVRDRGPYVAGRTFDLEKSLSDRLGMTPAGHATVRYRCG